MEASEGRGLSLQFKYKGRQQAVLILVDVMPERLLSPGLANAELLANTVFICKRQKLEEAAIHVLFPATNRFPYPHLQYDFVELLDGSRLIAREQRNLVDSERAERAGRQARSVSLHEAGFIQYLDSGIWHLAFYNDGKNPEPVSFNTIVIGKSPRQHILSHLLPELHAK